MAVDGLEFITLDELDRTVPLRVRADRKHLLAITSLDALLRRLAPTHRALEIDGRRAFAYDTVYFDTADLLTARAHVQRRRRRFKCRSRLYADTSTCAFELKLKGARGETVKHRIAYDPSHHGIVTPDARAFLAEHLDEVPDLRPVLRTTYTRITLAAAHERTTIDLGLSYGDAWLRPGWAIVETKSDRGAGIADRELRRLGSRPLSLSKYVLGTGLIHMPTPPNDTRRIARRYFAHA
jgi:VTC domain